MRVHRLMYAVGVIAVASTLACSDTTSCPNNPNLPIYPNAIVISVLDSVSSRPIADSASGVGAWGASSDTLWHTPYRPDSVVFLGWGAGSYAVAIARPGYQQWLRSGIVVPASGSCSGYLPVDITARLQPAP